MKPTFLAAAALLACATSASAAPLQVTTGGYNSFGPALSADGSRLVFYSASDLTGGNPDHNFEVYVYERATGQTRQLSDSAGGILAGGNQTPSISGDGSRVAFQHFNVSGGYAYFQTQSYDLATNTLTTLTQPPGFFEQSAISRDGKRIAVSTDNLGVRLYDTATQTFSGVVAPWVLNMSLSGDGQRLAFETFSGVKLLDLGTGITINVAPQSASFNERPTLSADGRTLAFVSNFDPLGQNADGNRELFSYDILTGTLTQVTHTLGSYLSLGGLSGDGSRIAFSTGADLTGGNADGNTEVFVYDLLAGDFMQVTHTLGAYNSEARLSEDGLSIAYLSFDLPGSPSQVFLDALAPQPHGALPEPASLALAVAGIAALGAVRSGRRPRR